MVQVKKCSCNDIEEAKINSMKLFKQLKSHFESDEYEEVTVQKPLKIMDNNQDVVTQWYPTKWYRCKINNILWAFQYPDFPAQGSLYRLGADGNPIEGSIFYFENKVQRVMKND